MAVMMHNFGGYDSHNFFGDVETVKGESVFILAKGATKFYTVRIGELAFIDTLNYFPFSLAKLSDTMTGGNEQMDLPITRKILESRGYSKSLIDRTMGKGCFPYEYIDCIEKFSEKGPPPKEAFNSSLTGPISDEKYQEVCELYTYNKINTIKDHHDYYLATDVGVLADVGERYRDFSREQWGLDSANYLTSASLYVDAALKESKQDLDLISDPNLYEMMEKSICGGFVTVVKRHVVANNIHVTDYDPNKPDTLVLLLDFNGLYAGIQEQKCPTGDFKLLTPDQQIKFEEKLRKRTVDFKGDVGYWVEYDYHIPAEVARKTDELPLSLYVADNIRGSDYMRSLLNGKKPPKGAKLVATHLPVEKASHHIKWLDFLIEQGLVIDKVHRVWSFTQKPFLQSYVSKNMKKRANIDNEFFKAILKLASNAPYGKFLEQKRKRNVKSTFVRSVKELRKHARCAFFKGRRRLGKNKCIVERYAKKILLDVPIYVGNTILQLAKHQYWSFYYNVLKPAFGNDVSLLYGDTDSMMLEFQIPKGSTFKQLLDHPTLSQYIDRSNLKDPSLKDNKFKGKSGYLKSETADDIIESAVMLKPKLYSIKTKNGRKMAAKGVSMANIEPIPHTKFEEILRDSRVSVKRPQTYIRKVNGKMCTVRTNKETVNAFENKSFWLDAYRRYSYGHPDIKDMPGGSECYPVRYKCGDVVPSYNATGVHTTIVDDELAEDEMVEENDVLAGIEYEHVDDAEIVSHSEPGSSVVDNDCYGDGDDLFNESFDDVMLGIDDPESYDDLFNKSFDELLHHMEDSESCGDLFNESFDELVQNMEDPESCTKTESYGETESCGELFNVSFEDLPDSIPAPKSSNLKRKPDCNPPQCKRFKHN